MFQVYMWGGGKASPSVVEHFKEGRSALQVAVGGSHAAVLTIEKELYTWQVHENIGIRHYNTYTCTIGSEFTSVVFLRFFKRDHTRLLVN